MLHAYVIQSSLRQYFSVRRMLPWLVLGIAAAGMGLIWTTLSPGAETMERYSSVSTMLVYRIMVLAAAIFATSIVSQEVEQKTIVYLLTRPIPRASLILSRYLAAALSVAAIGAFGALALGFAVFGPGALQEGQIWRDLGALTLGAFSYCALFLLVTLLINRAMTVCLLFAFGWETTIPSMPGSMYRLSIQSYLQGFAKHPVQDAESPLAKMLGLGEGVASLTPIASAATLIVFTGVVLGVCAWWFSTFEYVPREDAE